MDDYVQLRSTMHNQTIIKTVRFLSVCTVAAVLSACSQPKTLYSWESYQPSVYAYLEKGGTDHLSQTEDMEENIQTASAQNKALPPGFHAHLGMLYLKNGQTEKATEQFEKERVTYPESVWFMDFLLKNKAPDTTAPTGQPSPSTNGSATTQENRPTQGS